MLCRSVRTLGNHHEPTTFTATYIPWQVPPAESKQPHLPILLPSTHIPRDLDPRSWVKEHPPLYVWNIMKGILGGNVPNFHLLQKNYTNVGLERRPKARVGEGVAGTTTARNFKRPKGTDRPYGPVCEVESLLGARLFRGSTYFVHTTWSISKSSLDVRHGRRSSDQLETLNVAWNLSSEPRTSCIFSPSLWWRLPWCCCLNAGRPVWFTSGATTRPLYPPSCLGP